MRSQTPIRLTARIRYRTALLIGLPILLCVQAATPGAFAQSVNGPGQRTQLVGHIEGRALIVRGPGAAASVSESEADLMSGSAVSLGATQARLDVAGGSALDFCGPAQFTVLRSGNTITLALNYGRVTARLEEGTMLAVFTPLVIATPISIGTGLREASVGLENSGRMCIRAARGAVRLEQQLSGEVLIVPQLGEVTLERGQIQAIPVTGSTCRCEVMLAKSAPPLNPAPPPQATAGVQPAPASTAGSTLDEQKRKSDSGNQLDLSTSLPQPGRPVQPQRNTQPVILPPPNTPVWRVDVAPLVFDAKNPPPPPDPSPEILRITREARVEQDWVFNGTVGVSEIAAALPHLQPKGNQPSPEDSPPPRKPNSGDKVRGFFRRLFGGGAPCAGAGCPKP